MLRDNEGARREERSGAEECEDAAVFLSSGIRRESRKTMRAAGVLPQPGAASREGRRA